MFWREVRRRLLEVASLASCALNIVIGTGDREVTLSAGAWELRRRGVRRGRWLVVLIDRLNRPWTGPCHCKRAWTDHCAVWSKVRAEQRGVADA
ncbi:hypothetical protein [Niveispirillum fermenti]|uniref:hypothetical protein n=1 Tax=Niveispirillum fermenti TaxID=1233113 RepID=UPI003A8429E8